MNLGLCSVILELTRRSTKPVFKNWAIKTPLVIWESISDCVSYLIDVINLMIIVFRMMLKAMIMNAII